MHSDIEQTIMQYYPQRSLVSPLDNDDIRWDYDPEHKSLKELLEDLKTIDPDVRPGTRGDYVISEEIVVLDGLRLQVCYLGPYAAVNYGFDRDFSEKERDALKDVKAALAKHGFTLLENDDLTEQVPWIQHGTETMATVWNCLFAHHND